MIVVGVKYYYKSCGEWHVVDCTVMKNRSHTIALPGVGKPTHWMAELYKITV